MPPKPVVLVTERIAEVGLQLLDKSCQICAPWRQNRLTSEEELSSADAIIVRLFKITEAVLSAAPKLRVVGRHGAGIDNVDLKAATERRIPVVFTPSAQTMANAVAEHTVQMMLALARHAVAGDRMVREGHFAQRLSLQGVELHGKTLGVIGLGAIGTRVAEICRDGFGMRVVAFDPYSKELPSQKGFTRLESLHALLRQSDVVTLHVPATDETFHLINTETLAHMKQSALLINVARGSVLDTVALAEALSSGRLQGAALDVFEEEPPPTDHPLMSAPGTIFSPHIGSSTEAAMDRMAELVARQVIQVLKGEWPAFVANPAVIANIPAV